MFELKETILFEVDCYWIYQSFDVVYSYHGAEVYMNFLTTSPRAMRIPSRWVCPLEYSTSIRMSPCMVRSSHCSGETRGTCLLSPLQAPTLSQNA